MLADRLAAITVYGSLNLLLRIQQGETFLVPGATSRVGLLSVQFSKQAGLTVVATTRYVEKKNFLINKGADSVLIDNGEIHE